MCYDCVTWLWPMLQSLACFDLQHLGLLHLSCLLAESLEAISESLNWCFSWMQTISISVSAGKKISIPERMVIFNKWKIFPYLYGHSGIHLWINGEKTFLHFIASTLQNDHIKLKFCKDGLLETLISKIALLKTPPFFHPHICGGMISTGQCFTIRVKHNVAITGWSDINPTGLGSIRPRNRTVFNFI